VEIQAIAHTGQYNSQDDEGIIERLQCSSPLFIEKFYEQNSDAIHCQLSTNRETGEFCAIIALKGELDSISLMGSDSFLPNLWKNAHSTRLFYTNVMDDTAIQVFKELYYQDPPITDVGVTFISTSKLECVDYALCLIGTINSAERATLMSI